MSNNFVSKMDDFARKSIDVATGGSSPLGQKLGISSETAKEKWNLTSREYGKMAMYKDGGKVSKKPQPKAPHGGLVKMGKCC